jgi:8-oxo-dGTP diphosphatase
MKTTNQQRAQRPVAEYVVGYCFNEDFSEVALIEKRKPAWQAGKLNGIGGKVEPGENIVEAMAREFEEEAGVYIGAALWLHIRTEWFGAEQEAARAQPTGAKVHHFACCIPNGAFARISTMEAEQVVKVRYPLDPLPTIYNLPYLIPMAAILLQQPSENRPLP